MTKKEEPRGESIGSQSVSATWVVAIAVVMLAVGLIGGYYVLGAYMPLAPETTSPGGVTTAQPEKFVYNEAKINELTKTFEDYFYVYSQGQEVQFTYDSYIEMDNYVKLIYILDGQEFDIYITKDYQELYPSVLKYNEFKADVEAAKAQMSSAPATTEPEELEKSDEPEVLLFVMSFCPYGNVAENAMAPVVDSIGESMYFEPIYIVSGGPGAWRSLHGNVELNQDVREKIIYNLYGPDVWMDYVYDINQKCDYNNADTCWKAPAEAMGINTSAVEELFANQTYVDELLMKDASLGTAYGVSGSPTLIINGKTMSIARTPEAYKQAVCDADLTPDENCTVELSEESTAPTGSCG